MNQTLHSGLYQFEWMVNETYSTIRRAVAMEVTMLMPLLQQGVLSVKLLPDMAKDSTAMLQYSDASDFQFQDLCWSETPDSS